MIDLYLVSYLWLGRTSLCREKRFMLEINGLAHNQMKLIFHLVFSLIVDLSDSIEHSHSESSKSVKLLVDGSSQSERDLLKLGNLF